MIPRGFLAVPESASLAEQITRFRVQVSEAAIGATKGGGVCVLISKDGQRLLLPPEGSESYIRFFERFWGLMPTFSPLEGGLTLLTDLTLAAEYCLLTDWHISTTCVFPGHPKHPLTWRGLILPHDGLYGPSTYKFFIHFPPTYPLEAPIVQFDPPFPHALINQQDGIASLEHVMEAEWNPGQQCAASVVARIREMMFHHRFFRGEKLESAMPSLPNPEFLKEFKGKQYLALKNRIAADRKTILAVTEPGDSARALAVADDVFGGALPALQMLQHGTGQTIGVETFNEMLAKRVNVALEVLNEDEAGAEDKQKWHIKRGVNFQISDLKKVRLVADEIWEELVVPSLGLDTSLMLQNPTQGQASDA